MNICGFIVIVYLFVGVVLAYIWWHDEYEPEYELERENDGIEEPMAVLFLAALAFFWLFKVVKNYFENFVD